MYDIYVPGIDILISILTCRYEYVRVCWHWHFVVLLTCFSACYCWQIIVLLTFASLLGTADGTGRGGGGRGARPAGELQRKLRTVRGGDTQGAWGRRRYVRKEIVSSPPQKLAKNIKPKDDQSHGLDQILDVQRNFIVESWIAFQRDGIRRIRRTPYWAVSQLWTTRYIIVNNSQIRKYLARKSSTSIAARSILLLLLPCHSYLSLWPFAACRHSFSRPPPLPPLPSISWKPLKNKRSLHGVGQARGGRLARVRRRRRISVQNRGHHEPQGGWRLAHGLPHLLPLQGVNTHNSNNNEKTQAITVKNDVTPGTWYSCVRYLVAAAVCSTNDT